MESDYNKGYTYLCSIANYIETKEDLIRKLKDGGIQDPEAVFKKLLADEEIVPGKKEGTYLLKFKKCRGGEDDDIISE
jgi:hypothetical protein